MEYKSLKLQEVIPPTTKVRGFPDDIYHEEDGAIDASTLFSEITRFEYISENGREIVEHGKFEFQLQDGEQTLKVFKL